MKNEWNLLSEIDSQLSIDGTAELKIITGKRGVKTLDFTGTVGNKEGEAFYLEKDEFEKAMMEIIRNKDLFFVVDIKTDSFLVYNQETKPSWLL